MIQQAAAMIPQAGEKLSTYLTSASKGIKNIF